MAIYSQHLGFVSRSAGESSVGYSSYICGEKGYDQRTGVAYDFSNKSEVIVSRVLAPEGAPDWAKNSHTLWNRVERFEDDIASLRFKNEEAKNRFLGSAQTAQTVMCAIPVELNKEQAEACVEEYLNERFVSRGLVANYGLHWEKNNPHFHAAITRRALIDGEFSSRKDREIVSRAEHYVSRKVWEDVANKHLKLAGHEVRIDCRSNADRGSLFIPSHHEGWYAQNLALDGKYSRIVAENEAIRQHNIKLIYERPETLIHEVSLKRTTFTRRHLEDEIMRRVGGDEKLFSVLKAKVEGVNIPFEQILSESNDSVVYDTFAKDMRYVATQLTDTLLSDKDVAHKVGQNINDETIYTSVQYKKQEELLTQLADQLKNQKTKAIGYDKIDAAIQTIEQKLSEGKPEPFSYFTEQKEAIHHLCSNGDITILNGKAGTGKTTLLKAVAEIHAQQGYRVLGTSFQGKAVEIMEQEIGIPCRTIHSLKASWEKHEKQKALVESGKLWGNPYYFAIAREKELAQSRFTSNDVIIVDEANMIGGSLWESLLKEATTQGAKVIIVQDPSQIKSREAGDYGRLFAEKYGTCETKMVVRQKVEWQRECSEKLNDHHVLDGLLPYQEKGHIHWFETQEQAQEKLVSDYLKDMKDNPEQTRIALAYRNQEVFELNQKIRAALISEGHLTEHFKFAGQEYSIGDQIRFTDNDNHGAHVKNEGWFWQNHNQPLGVKNGSVGTIIGFDEKEQQLKVRLNEDRVVHFKAEDYSHITHGYAMGIHKSEGSTFDRGFVSPDVLMDPHTTLVPMTRHRDDVQMYVSRDQFIDFKDLVDKLSYGGMRETLQDHQVTESQRPYFENVRDYKNLTFEASTLREEMESSTDSSDIREHPLYEAYGICFEQKKALAEAILDEWQAHSPYIKLAGLRRDVLEVETEKRPRLLSDLEFRASIQVQGYMDAAKQARTLWGTISQTHPGIKSRSHELYPEYKVIREERNSLAAVFHEGPRLYRQFFVYKPCDSEDKFKNYWGDIVPKDERVFFASVKNYANEHYKSQLHEIYLEKLTTEDKEEYKRVEAYRDARNQSATLYSDIKNKGENETQAEDKNQVDLDKFKKIQELRDHLAHEIICTLETYKAPFRTSRY